MIDIPVLDMSRMVAFVNEYADRPREVADEQDRTYPDPAELLAWPGRPPTATADELVDAANATFRVFAAAPEGHALDELNALLRAVRPAPLATTAGLRWTVDTPDDTLTAALTVCLLDWLTHHDQARLGTCHAARCVDAYADTSPAGRRRFCSTTCLNRHKVAAYRRRAPRRAGGDGRSAGAD